jgi:transposase
VGAGRALLPKKERRFRYPGRKRLDDRLALQGILFVLHTGIAWRHLPRELGFRLRLDLLSPPRVRSSGRARWPTPATCRRKRGRRNRPEPG